MATDAVVVHEAVGAGERVALAAALTELELRPNSAYRHLIEPVADLERRAAALGADELVMRARLLRAGALLREGRLEDGGRAVHDVLRWAERHGGPYLVARAHRELSVFHRQVGDTAQALTHAVQSVALLGDDVPPAARARHLLSLAVALDESGSPEEGHRRFLECLEIAGALDDHELTLYALNNMAYTAYEAGDVAGAQRLVERMRAVRARSGRTFGANELDTVARVEMLAGRWDAVERTLGGVLDAGPAAVLGDEGDAVAECLLTLAEARRSAGRYAAAQQALDATVRTSDERRLGGIRARARAEQAALHAATGDFRRAYEEHVAYHAATVALHSAQREARARAVQAVFEADEARRASEHFREMALRDALTGLHNRRYVDGRLPVLLDEAAARCRPVSVALLDLDRFKRINDTLSHSAGDAVLQRVSALLEAAAPGACVAARMGGEEFVLIMPGVGTDEAVRRCEALRERVRTAGWGPVTGELPVTVSIGVTCTTEGARTPAELLAGADRRLYAAKRGGRDRVVAAD